MEFERGLIAAHEDEIEEMYNAPDRLTLKELTAQLCELETRLELRIGDLPAAQIIRAACRRLELQRREIESFAQKREVGGK